MAYLTGGACSGRTQLPVDAVEHAVDEPARLRRAELLGDLDGLVDGDLARHRGLAEQLVDGHPQYIAADHGHAVAVPVPPALGDDRVERRPLRPDRAPQPAADYARSAHQPNR